MPKTTRSTERAQTDSSRPSGSLMPLWAQRTLAIVAVLALVGLLIAIWQQIAATQPGSVPARVTTVQAGPYPLTVDLYRNPADAGYALPLAIAPSQPVSGTLTYTVTAIPDRGQGVDATPVNATLGRDAHTPNRVSGTVEITVRGPWVLNIVVSGPAGKGEANIAITAKAPPPLPTWIAWPIGLIPAIGIALFLLAQRRRGRELVATESE